MALSHSGAALLGDTISITRHAPHFMGAAFTASRQKAKELP
jgi:hypothetical protein